MIEGKRPIVGIDLGTTNSVVAAVIDGQPCVLEENGERILPSVVGLTATGQLITGIPARNQLSAFPDRTIASVKRHMGKMERLLLGDQTFTPPEISAMILRRLRDRASRALGQPVERAVIAVPAFFDENQRQATHEAGELAGLQVERIINEPTAATLVYHAGELDRRRILVYDFGGGTFDVSIVQMEAGVVEVLTSNGDTHLGGDDLDQALLDHLADRFLDEHGLDLRESPGTRYRLRQACELAKRQLSNNESTLLAEEFLVEKDGRPLHLRYTVTRDELERLVMPYVDRTIDCVDAALREAGMTVHQLDDLVLVGGSTRIPLVEERLRDEFKREPSRAVDPDLAVALGAAMQAAMISGDSVGPVLVDVTPHTLGIEVCEDISWFTDRTVFSPIIHRNSPLPARYENAYSKVVDHQVEAEIHVLQGEHEDVHRNRSIGRFRVNLESGGGDRNKIVVRFDLGLDGTLKVVATQSATGISQELTIRNALSQFRQEEREVAQARLGAMFDASDELLEDADLPERRTWTARSDKIAGDRTDRIDAAEPAGFPDAYALLARAEEVRRSAQPQDVSEIDEIVAKLRSALSAEDDDAVTSLSVELDDILFYVRR